MTQDRDLGGSEGEQDRDKSLEVLIPQLWKGWEVKHRVLGVWGDCRASSHGVHPSQHLSHSFLLCICLFFAFPPSYTSPSLTSTICSALAGSKGALLSSTQPCTGGTRSLGSQWADSAMRAVQRWKAGRERLVNWSLKVRNFLGLV